MIAAIPIKEVIDESQISERFARSRYFAIVNTESKKMNVVENPFYDKSSGAGKSVLEQLIIKYSVDTLIAFELGVKIQKAANEKGLQLILLDNINRTLQEILDMLKI